MALHAAPAHFARAGTSSGASLGGPTAAGDAAAGLSPPGAAICLGGAVCKVKAPEAKVIPFSANARYIRFRYSRCTQLGFTGRAVNLKRATTAFSVISAMPCS